MSTTSVSTPPWHGRGSASEQLRRTARCNGNARCELRGRRSAFPRTGADFVANSPFARSSTDFVAGAPLSQDQVQISRTQHFRQVRCRFRGRRRFFARDKEKHKQKNKEKYKEKEEKTEKRETKKKRRKRKREKYK